jgi:hypothetical protein
MTPRQKARSWLFATLSNRKPRRAVEIQTLAQQARYNWRTVNRAKKELGVIATRTGGLGAGGYWTWTLPPKAD